ncbi:MAG: DUF7311 family protein [Halolamina sp.]
MIRALLAVTLAAALLAASLPAVESAAADRTAASLDREVDRIERGGASLLAEEDVGARRVVSVSLPAASLAGAGVDSFALGCGQRCSVSYTLSTGAARTRRLDVPLATPEGTIRFATPGVHRLSLRLIDGDDRSDEAATNDDAGPVVAVSG